MPVTRKAKKGVACKNPRIKVNGSLKCREKSKAFIRKDGKICCRPGRVQRIKSGAPVFGLAKYNQEQWHSVRRGDLLALMDRKSLGAVGKLLAAEFKAMDQTPYQDPYAEERKLENAAKRKIEGMCPKSRRFTKQSVCKNTGRSTQPVGPYWCCPIKKSFNAYTAHVTAEWARHPEWKEELAMAVSKEDRNGIFSDINARVRSTYVAPEAEVPAINPGVYTFKEMKALIRKSVEGRVTLTRHRKIINNLKEAGAMYKDGGKWIVGEGFNQEGQGIKKFFGLQEQEAGSVNLKSALMQLQKFTQQQQ